MKRTLLFFLLFLNFAFAPKVELKKGKYVFDISKVDVNNQNATGNITQQKNGYIDSDVKIRFGISNEHFIFWGVENRSENAIKIKMNEIALIDENGTSKCYSANASPKNWQTAQEDKEIPVKDFLINNLYPVNNIYQEQGGSGKWMCHPIIDVKTNSSGSKIEYKPEIIGQHLKLVIPIEIQGDVKKYSVDLEIKFKEE